MKQPKWPTRSVGRDVEKGHAKSWSSEPSSGQIRKIYPGFAIEEEEIILCGKIDWLDIYQKQTKSTSLTLKLVKTMKMRITAIAHLLFISPLLQHRAVAKASYWYLESSDE